MRISNFIRFILILTVALFTVDILGTDVEVLDGFTSSDSQNTIESYQIVNGDLSLDITTATNVYYITNWKSLFPLYGDLKNESGTYQDLYLYSDLTLNGNITGTNNICIYGKDDIVNYQRNFYFNRSSLSLSDDYYLYLGHINMYLENDLTLGDSSKINSIWLSSSSILDLQGHTLTITNGYVADGGVITNGNIILNGGKIYDLTLKDVNLILTNNYTQSNFLTIKGDVHIIGNGYSFTFNYDDHMTIEKNATLYLENVNFILKESNDFLYFQDSTSTLYLGRNTIFQTHWNRILGYDSSNNYNGGNIIIDNDVEFKAYKVKVVLDQFETRDINDDNVTVNNLTFYIPDCTGDPSDLTLPASLPGSYSIISGTVVSNDITYLITDPDYNTIFNITVSGNNLEDFTIDINYGPDVISTTLSGANINATTSIIPYAISLDSKVNLQLLSGAQLNISVGTLKYVNSN